MKHKSKDQWGKFRYTQPKADGRERCRRCVWNERIRCGADFCPTPKCMKAGRKYETDGETTGMD